MSYTVARRSTLLLWTTVLLGACAGGTSSTMPGPETRPESATGDRTDAARRVTALADEYFQAFIETYPLYGLFLGVPEAPTDRIGDNSLAAVRAWEKREDRWLNQLKEVPADALYGRPEEVTYGVLLETLTASQQTRVCRSELWPLNQQNGWQIFLPVTGQLQPIGTTQLRANAIARWRAMPAYIDVEIGNLREGLRQGYTQPRANAEAVLEQLNAVLSLPAEKSPFAQLAGRDSTPGFGDSVIAVVRRDILPAVARYRDFLQAEYIPGSRRSTALSALPQGADCYRARVRQYTTSDLDAEAVHQLGLRQIAALEAEMVPIARRSFGTADLPALIRRFREDSQYTFRSREEIIRTAEQAVARAKAAMPKWFGRLPKSEMIVDPCLPFEEKSGCPNSYVPGTPDGKRPGRWRINAGNQPPQPRAPLEGTAFHESIPGHHLQFTLAQERVNAHPIARYLFFSSFSEGWALYAERMAIEMGLYSSDLYQLGELGEQSLRAARLVVDPGLAVLGWSRQRAIEYMLEHTMLSSGNVESEVDRYIADPGQATAYMVGRLEIERLRQAAEAQLGEGFDIREFHDRVLESGSVPLPLLRAHIQEWLKSETRGASAASSSPE
jgi:uncharacterized protein (DUF885 family)